MSHTSHTSTPPSFGLVLAGGKSSRMGQDKSMMHYHGLSQLDYLVQLMESFVSNSYISCHPERIPETEHEIIVDAFADSGPFSGILSAFQFKSGCAWMVVACDMPLLDADVFGQLIHGRDKNAIATCFYDPETLMPEPLFAIWEPASCDILHYYFRKGECSLRKILMQENVRRLQINDPQKLRNANTMEEATRLRTLILKK